MKSFLQTFIALCAVAVLPLLSPASSHEGEIVPVADLIKAEDVYAGACYAYSHNKRDECDLVIVESWRRGKFFFGNSWNSLFSLSSNWCDSEGGTREEVTSYLRANKYRHIGRLDCGKTPK